MIAFTELAWRASFLFLEDAVEVAEIVESAIKTYLADTLGGIYQHAGSIPQTQVDDILRDISAGMELEETAERTAAHACQRGKLRQTEFIHIVLGDEILHLQDAPAIVFYRYLGITAGSQGAGIFAA